MSTSVPRIAEKPDKIVVDTLSVHAKVPSVDALRAGDRGEAMSRRRYQDPTPKRRGAWWEIQIRRDDVVEGKHVRTKTRVRIAPAEMGEREVRKVAAEFLRPTNHDVHTFGSATDFAEFVADIFNKVTMPLFSSSTQSRYRGVIKNYLLPNFGGLALREMTSLNLQKYFVEMSASKLSHQSRDKIRDVLSSILSSAVKYGMLASNPAENVRIPSERRGRKTSKPFLYPNQFDELLTKVPEPYASMLYVAIYTGIRGLRTIVLLLRVC